MERVCDLSHITLNKNTVLGDASALTPGGVRIGAPAMTSRGLQEADFEKIGDLLVEALEICKEVQARTGKKMKDFNVGLEENPRVVALKAQAEAFAVSFPMPGFASDAGK